MQKSKKKRFWKSITNPEDLMTVVVYPVQHLASSNSVCRGALLVFHGSNVYQGTLVKNQNEYYIRIIRVRYFNPSYFLKSALKINNY